MPQSPENKLPLLPEAWLIGDPAPYARARIDQVFIGKVPAYIILPTPNALIEEYQTMRLLKARIEQYGDDREDGYDLVIITDNFGPNALEETRKLQKMSKIPVPIAFATNKAYSPEEQLEWADSVCLWIPRHFGSGILDKIARSTELQDLLRTKLKLSNYQGWQTPYL